MVDQANSVPVSLPGIVVMVLLAYTIFTTTLVLQRKQAAFGLAVGLASLTIPLVLLLAISRVHPALPVFTAAVALLLFRGLRPGVRVYLFNLTAVARENRTGRVRSGRAATSDCPDIAATP